VLEIGSGTGARRSGDRQHQHEGDDEAEELEGGEPADEPADGTVGRHHATWFRDGST
jgi:hypothetical protein